MKLIDKLWNWGHLAGCHNDITGFDCEMTPEEFAKEYGIKNTFMVSYGGNIQPPFDDVAKSLDGLDKVVWSVLGDSSTPLPSYELGFTNHIVDVSKNVKNITGGVVDDFFSPERMERFNPEVLRKIKETLNSNGLSFWCVLYENQLELELEKYIECFDGITFWIWESKNIPHMDEYFEKLKSLSNGKPVMLGIYLIDYANDCKQLDSSLFEMQLKKQFELLKDKSIEGVIVCSSTIGDAPLETNRILKEYITKYGETEI